MHTILYIQDKYMRKMWLMVHSSQGLVLLQHKALFGWPVSYRGPWNPNS